MLLKPEELHYFSDFGYHHDNLQRTPGNAPRQQLLRSPQISHLDYDQVETGGLGCRCKADADALHLAPWCQDRFDRAMGA